MTGISSNVTHYLAIFYDLTINIATYETPVFQFKDSLIWNFIGVTVTAPLCTPMVLSFMIAMVSFITLTPQCLIFTCAVCVFYL
jgi:hypothetical protein